MNKLLLISLALVGCAQQNDMIQDTSIFTGIDPIIQTYFDRFTYETGVSTAGITAGFTTLSNNIAGLCAIDGPYREIRLDQTNYNNIMSSDLEVEQLVFHELGHCALFLMHINNCITNGVLTDPADAQQQSCPGQPQSIMNWQSFNPNQITFYSDVTQHAYYIHALTVNQPIP